MCTGVPPLNMVHRIISASVGLLADGLLAEWVVWDGSWVETMRGFGAHHKAIVGGVNEM